MQRSRKESLLPNFRIFETNQFTKDLNQNFGSYQKQIQEKLINHVYPQLRDQPYFGKNIKKLRDYKPETWRYRISSYRFFYAIDDKEKIVFMIAADNRKDAY